MNFITGLIKWFDGKKTAIGSAFLLAVTIINQWVIGVNHYHPGWLNVVIDNFTYVGETLAGLGLGHKGIKAIAEKIAKAKAAKNGAQDPDSNQ